MSDRTSSRRVILPHNVSFDVEKQRTAGASEQKRRKTLAESLAEAVARARGAAGISIGVTDKPRQQHVYRSSPAGAPGSSGKRQLKRARREARARQRPLKHGRTVRTP